MSHESPYYWDDPNQEEDMGIVRTVADTYDFGRHDGPGPEPSRSHQYDVALAMCQPIEGPLMYLYDASAYVHRITARMYDNSPLALAALENMRTPDSLTDPPYQV